MSEGPRRPQHHRGVAVNLDDIFFGDDDGIVVATAPELVEAIPVAEVIQSKEETALSRMREGESLVTLVSGGFADFQTGGEARCLRNRSQWERSRHSRVRWHGDS